MHTNMLEIKVLFMKMSIPTKPSNKLANKILDHSKFQDTLMSEIATLYQQPSKEDLFQLPLMLPTGQDIQAEFSATAPPDLTTVLHWLE